MNFRNARNIVSAGMVLWASGLYQSYAAESQPPPVSPSNRYLVIVESSRTMGRRAPQTIAALEHLIGSGLNKEARKGDSLGLWTYNQELTAGKFPLQNFSTQNGPTVAGEVSKFLGQQDWGKRADWFKVWPTLQQVMTNSHLLTVILINSGTTEIHGTPFDAAINKVYSEYRAQQQDKRMPFVTLLRARDGVVTDYVVSLVPPQAVLPPLPPPPAPVAQAKPSSTTNPPPRILPSLIISGKKADAPVAAKPPTNPPAARTELLADTPANALRAGTSRAPASATLTNEKIEVLPSRQGSQGTNLPTPPTLSAQERAAGQNVPRPALANLSSNAPVLVAKTTQEPTNRIDAPPAEAFTAPPPITPAPATVPVSPTASRGLLLRGAYLAIACLVLPALLALFIPRYLRNRSRSVAEVSLITRSLDRTATREMEN